MGQIAAIQILRAIAALAIALLHTLSDADAIVAASGADGGFVASQLLPLQAGVDLFFVISGFIMVYASQALFGQPHAAWIFTGRRVARIVPLYWATTTLFLAVSFLAPQLLNTETPAVGEIISAYFFYPIARADGLVQPVFSLGWSLNYEMYFYAAFALMLAFERRAAVLAIALYFAASVLAGSAVSAKPTPIQFWTDPIVLEFVAGALLADVYLKGARLRPLYSVSLIVTALALLHLDLSQPPYGLARGLSWGIPVAMLFSAATFSDLQMREGAVQSALIKIGDASYALYLVHPFTMRALKHLWLKFGMGMLGSLAYIAVALSLAVAVALLIYAYFERPVERKLRSLLGSALAL